MSERDTRDIERRLRDVVDGPRPAAPQSLHRFLLQMPESEAARRRRRLGILRAAVGLPRLAPTQPAARRLQTVLGVALAVLIGLAGGGLLINLRQSPAVPLASGSPLVPSPQATSQRSMSTRPTALTASLGLMNLVCTGVPVGAEGMALPKAAVVTRAGKYLGVTDGMLTGASGTSGMVVSTDGLYWDWSPPSAIDPQASALTSIASDNLDTIVVTGSVQGVDGSADGRIWVSVNDGATWQAAADEAVFKGITVQTVVYGSGQFVALGWNEVSPADSLRQVAEWRSVDGRSWTHVTTPVKGTTAVIVPTAAGFLLSGTPLTSGAIDEPPMWHSPNGVTWTRSRTSDTTAQSMGPLSSVAVTGQSHVYGVTASNDGTSHGLVTSPDGGLTWATVRPDTTLPSARSLSDVASLNSNDTQYGAVEYLFATLGQGGPNIYVSTNGGVTWQVLENPSGGGPAGTTLLQLGNGYLVGQTGILTFGAPGSGLGIWLIGFPTGS